MNANYIFDVCTGLAADWAIRGLKKIGSGRVADAFIRRRGVLTATVDLFRRGAGWCPGA